MKSQSIFASLVLLSSAHAASIDGRFDPGYGEAAGHTLAGFTLPLNPRPGGMALAPSGRTWMFGANQNDTSHILITRLAPSSGLLDPAFGPNNDGRRTVVLPAAYRDPTIFGAAVQPDGKPFVFGHLGQSDGNGGYGGFVCRFNVAGTLDNSFSGDGCQLFRSGISNSETCEVHDVVFDLSDRAVVSGHCRLLPSQDHHRFLARLNTAGNFDVEFAGGIGMILPPLPPDQSANQQEMPTVAITADGMIMTLSTVDSIAHNWDVVVSRYDDGGTLDPTFGIGGHYVLPLDTEVSDNSLARDMVLLPDGKVVVLAEMGFSDNYMVLAKVLANGSGLDVGFGNGGLLFDPIASIIFGSDRILVDDIGRIISIARGSDLQQDACHWITRYTRAGALDPNFGQGGRICMNMPNTFGTTPTLNAFEVAGAFINREGLVIAAHAQNNQGLVNYFLSYRIASGELFRDGFE